MVGDFSPALAGDLAGSTMLGLASFASAGGFGRWFWAIVLGGTDTLAVTVSATATFSVTAGLAAGTVLDAGGDGGAVTVLAGVLVAVADATELARGASPFGGTAETATAVGGQR